MALRAGLNFSIDIFEQTARHFCSADIAGEVHLSTAFPSEIWRDNIQVATQIIERNWRIGLIRRCPANKLTGIYKAWWRLRAVWGFAIRPISVNVGVLKD
jgi:hypothetical protein